MNAPAPRYRAEDLTGWARDVFKDAGLDGEKATTVALVLVEGDLLGHDTHGLALLGPYLKKIAQGHMATSGEIEVVSDKPAALLWDGKKLPGQWLTVQAVKTACARARELGTASVVIKSSGHIACLAAYLEAPAREGLMVEIHSSDPSVASVAPFGGKRAVFTPNPIGLGIPTGGEPILIDISTSITTNGMSARLQAAGKRFPGKWLLDGEGHPTDDPAVFSQTPQGSIQLLGGVDAGHKGYGLTLMVEAMTGGLAGHGRADGVDYWGATVLVRVTDTAAFGGRDAFNRQLDWLVEACLETPAIDPDRPVRLPGHAGLRRKAAALSQGIQLNRAVADAIATIAADKAIALPDPI